MLRVLGIIKFGRRSGIDLEPYHPILHAHAGPLPFQAARLALYFTFLRSLEGGAQAAEPHLQFSFNFRPAGF